MSIRAVALRLEGVMQSWGASAAGYDRPTLEAPTHSGVLGIVGAALGIERTDVHALAGLHRSYLLAVQVVRAGTVGVDYHTALNVPPVRGWDLSSTRARRKATDDEEEEDLGAPKITRRQYLYDAAFRVLLVERESATVKCEQVVEALRHPRYLLALGRRACVPSTPILANREVVVGSDWKALFDDPTVWPNDDERWNTPRHDDQHRNETTYFIDCSLPDLTRTNGQRSIQFRVRDILLGTVERGFGERNVARVVLATVTHPLGHAVDTNADTTEGFGL